jgi:hypothetical protein
MNRHLFHAVTLVIFAVATFAVGIRGLENWALYELAVYYFFVALIAQGVRDRYVRPAAEAA